MGQKMKPQEILEIWNDSFSLAQVARRLKTSKKAASGYGCRLRQMGYPAKKFKSKQGKNSGKYEPYLPTLEEIAESKRMLKEKHIAHRQKFS